jgi:succinate dehydrogenase / fumarate reductase, cytochrome b subunit
MYRGQTGMLAWLLHRITGLGVLLFLLVHIVDISLLGFGPAVYNEGIALFGTPIVRFISLALIGAVFFHALNGIRIMLVDFVAGAARYQRSMFWAVMLLTFLGFIPIAYFVLAPIFGLHVGNTASGM